MEKEYAELIAKNLENEYGGILPKNLRAEKEEKGTQSASGDRPGK
jgi:hypothetical protein